MHVHKSVLPLSPLCLLVEYKTASPDHAPPVLDTAARGSLQTQVTPGHAARKADGFAIIHCKAAPLEWPVDKVTV